MRNSKEAFRYRRPMRLCGFDYRQSGIYFVTLCTHQKSKLFGSIYDGEMSLSVLGELVREEWQHIAQLRSLVQLDDYVVMPNHLHGLMIIEETYDNGVDSGDIANMSERTHTLQAGSLGAIISQFKAAVSRRAWPSLVERGCAIWQRNYYDHIVRNESTLNAIRRYIMENPARWAEDSLYVD